MKTLVKRALAAGATATLLVLPATPALAHHQPDHEQGSGGTTEQQDETNDVGESQHPSGNDRTDHQDQRQGESSSEPDADGRGPDRNDHGTDKPGEDGGVQNGDQDGNNGCGNDQDFEDDNEGWCGRNPNRGGQHAQQDQSGGTGADHEQEAGTTDAPQGGARDDEADGEQAAPATLGADDTRDDDGRADGTLTDGTRADDAPAGDTPAGDNQAEVMGAVEVRDEEPEVRGAVIGATRPRAGAPSEFASRSGSQGSTDMLARTGAEHLVLLLSGVGSMVGGRRLLRRRTA